MNTFNYPEDSITQSNYDEVSSYLNQTYPSVFQGLQLDTCNMDNFLSQVSMWHWYIRMLLLLIYY